MFRKPFREKLDKEGWEEAKKEGGNPSQKKQRIDELFLIALSDMVLLYEKLPEKDRDELYSLHNLKRFFDTLLSYNTTTSITNLEIATYLMKKSVEVFKEKFIQDNIDTSTIANLVNEPLDKALNICEEITYKEKLRQHGFKIADEKITYLCNWNKISNRDKNRFKDHLRNELGFTPQKFEIHHNQNNVNEFFGIFEDNLGKRYDLVLHKGEEYVSLTIRGSLLLAFQEFPIRSKEGEYLLYYRKDSFRKSENKTLPI